MGRNLEKLSSGLRIGRAADDAAGLAISEKMRAQIRGLNQAVRNAQDGISLIQTAEGALNETHSILQRMRELATQAANDTATDSDRAEIQKEIDQLKAEIDRIGNTTAFNTIKLIDGSIGAQKVAGTSNAAVIGDALGVESAAELEFAGAPGAGAVEAYTGSGATITIDGARIDFNTDAAIYKAFSDGANVDTDGLAAQLASDINAAIDAYNTANETSIAHVSVTSDAPTDGKLTITSGSVGATSTIDMAVGATGTGNLWEALGQTVSTNFDATGSEGVFGVAGAATATAVDAGDTMNVAIDGTTIAVKMTTVGANGAYTDGSFMSQLATDLATDINKAIDDYNATVPTESQLAHVSVSVKDGSLVVESGSSEATSSIKFDNSGAAQMLGLANESSATQGGGLKFQIGANQTQTMQVTISDMRVDALGLSAVSLTTREGAEEAITQVESAISQVSTQRAAIGAFQNRLEHTISNLGTSAENLQTADSRIRDADMAQEMMQFTKHQILLQAGTAMLAQANQVPQQVLQLLR